MTKILHVRRHGNYHEEERINTSVLAQFRDIEITHGPRTYPLALRTIDDVPVGDVELSSVDSHAHSFVWHLVLDDEYSLPVWPLMLQRTESVRDILRWHIGNIQRALHARFPRMPYEVTIRVEDGGRLVWGNGEGVSGEQRSYLDVLCNMGVVTLEAAW